MRTFKKGINIIPYFELEDYYENRISDLPINSSIEVISAYHYDNANTVLFINRTNENTWTVSHELRLFPETNPLLEEIVQEKQKHESLNIELRKKTYYELIVLIENDMLIKDLDKKIDWIKDDIIRSESDARNNKLYPTVEEDVSKRLPVYERAKNKILLELQSFANEVDKNTCNIVQILGRVKKIESIEEKVYRKKISPYEVFSDFDDIAGVRIVCEYVSDVYSLLEYISEHPLLNVIEIDDKIENPTNEGYRGVHVIVEVEVYYNRKLYKDIKVEIQMRTSFQNAWSMKTHELTYKKEEDIPEQILNQMKKLGETLNSADKEAEILKNKIYE